MRDIFYETAAYIYMFRLILYQVFSPQSFQLSFRKYHSLRMYRLCMLESSARLLFCDRNVILNVSTRVAADGRVCPACTQSRDGGSTCSINCRIKQAMYETYASNVLKRNAHAGRIVYRSLVCMPSENWLRTHHDVYDGIDVPTAQHTY